MYVFRERIYNFFFCFLGICFILFVLVVFFFDGGLICDLLEVRNFVIFLFFEFWIVRCRLCKDFVFL